MADNDRFGLYEMDLSLLYALLGEFIGCVSICFFGCASTMKFDSAAQPDSFTVAVTFGLMYTVCTLMFVDISEAHFNPAITAGSMILNQMKLVKGVLYILIHVFGYCVGVLSLLCVTPFDKDHKFFYRNFTLGYTAPSESVTITQALLIESVVTFVLMLTFLFTMHTSNSSVRLFAPFAIGFIYIGGITGFASFTGGSFNPARSFAPALFAGRWNDHWVYWIGPMLGALPAAILFKCIFKISFDEGDESNDGDATPKSEEEGKIAAERRSGAKK